MPSVDLALDHLIYVTSQDTIQAFEQSGFHVVAGGKHSDGQTANALITLSDGVYIELIYFLSSPPPATHWWSLKQHGWADWALTPLPSSTSKTPSETFVSQVNATPGIKDSDRFLAPQAGGRVTTDGTELKWKVTFPSVKELRGRTPFLCEDVTPRSNRVPSATRETHANGAISVKSIVLLAEPKGLQQYIQSLTPILGSATPSDASYAFKVKTPSGTALVVVREPESEQEVKWVKERGEGLYQVQLATAKEGQALSEFGITLEP